MRSNREVFLNSLRLKSRIGLAADIALTSQQVRQFVRRVFRSTIHPTRIARFRNPEGIGAERIIINHILPLEIKNGPGGEKPKENKNKIQKGGVM